MKIGVLTQPLHHNYGGVLQAYALVTVLREMGHEVVILNREYASEPSLKLYLWQTMSFLKCFYRIYVKGDKKYKLSNPLALTYYPLASISVPPLKVFINKELPLTKLLLLSSELSKYIKRAHLDAIIVGSDQVWRQAYSPKITDYFLAFLPEDSGLRKIAYAASFGTEQHDILQESLPECQRGIKKFDALSVREHSGVEILEKEFGVSAQQVLDPTLLLTASRYDHIIAMESENNKKTDLLSYILDTSTDATSIKEDVKQSLKASTLINLKIYSGIEPEPNTVAPTLPAWLNAFKHTRFVATDSFHGCVFSIIYRKPFVAIANAERGSDRFTSLLDSIGLSYRLVHSYDEYQQKKAILLQPVDYTEVYQKLYKDKERSMDFLKRSLDVWI